MRIHSSIDQFVSFLKGQSTSFDFLSDEFNGLRTKEKNILYDKSIVFKYYDDLKSKISNIKYESEDSHVLLFYDRDNLTHITKIRFDSLGLIDSFVEEVYHSDFKTMVLVVSYDGSKYYGMQKQVKEDQPTIQDEIEKALLLMTGMDIPITISSRTDRGVHALGQIVSFDSKGIDASRYIYALNRILPTDIRIKDAYSRSQLFNARYDSVKKTYQYIVDMGEYNLFNKNYCYYHRINNISKIRDELKSLIGTHDFKSFSKGSKNDTIRTIYDASIHLEDEKIIFTFTGSGFLHCMIRLIVGALLEIDSKGVGSIKAILDAKDKKKTSHVAPPEGLYLMSITY